MLDTGTTRSVYNVLGAVLVFALELSASTVSADDWISLSGPVFGTAYNIKAFSGSKPTGDLEKQIETSFEDIDRRMSTWRSDSDIS
ncbi:MAG: hypothetical protein AAF497_03190, partial [Planctomycetota bacterium]